MSNDYDKLKEDFRVFLFAIWRHLRLPQPTEVQNDIAQYLQHGPKRAVIEAFRGVGKSWITSVFVLWLLYCDPQLKILVVSASKERADAFTVFTKRLIAEVEFLKHLKPNKRKGQRDSAISFDVGGARAAHAPSVKSTGIFGQLAGSRADVIIADDVEVPKNSYTQGMRDRLSEAVKEFDAVLTANKDLARIIFLGTPQCEMSLYNLLPDRGYSTRIWTARMPGQKLMNFYGEKLSPWIKKKHLPERTPLEPTRFDDFDLAEREASYGRSGFQLQFMLDTSLSDANKFPLKLSDLIVFDIDKEVGPSKITYASGPEQMIPPQEVPMVGLQGDRLYRSMWVSDTMRPYQGKMMYIDPAGRGKDETGYAITYHLHGNIFLAAAGGFSGGYDKATLNKLALLAKEHSVNEIQIEPNFGDGMFNELFKPMLRQVYPCTLTDGPRATMQKERRIIDTLEPVMNQHRLIVDADLIKNDAFKTEEPKYQLFHQMTRLTKDRGSLAHDDRLDAVEGAVAYWMERLAKGQNEASEQYNEELLETELKKFTDSFHGFTQNEGPRWMHA